MKQLKKNGDSRLFIAPSGNRRGRRSSASPKFDAREEEEEERHRIEEGEEARLITP